MMPSHRRRIRPAGARALRFTGPAMSDALADSFRDCQRVARRTGKNFYWSFLTLPGDMRRDMCALYAFMRQTDDLGDDEAVSLAQRRGQLQDWQAATRAALGGTAPQVGPSAPLVTRGLPALADVVRRRGIPAQLLDEVIRGVDSDLTPRVYESFADLQAYCYLVAGAVGLACIHIWGYEGDDAPHLAIDCGTAFQVTNILRDLREDALRGRVYLPEEDLQRFGVSADDLSAGRLTPEFKRLMAWETQRAREFYARGEQLLPRLSPAGRRIHAAMLGIYGGLLDEIERRGFDVFTRRVELPARRKLAIAVRSWWSGGVARGDDR